MDQHISVSFTLFFLGNKLRRGNHRYKQNKINEDFDKWSAESVFVFSERQPDPEEFYEK